MVYLQNLGKKRVLVRKRKVAIIKKKKGKEKNEKNFFCAGIYSGVHFGDSIYRERAFLHIFDKLSYFIEQTA
jgi:hypothetical protein